MTRIYTRSGDAGKTGLANATRIAKSDALCDAIGDIDETNAFIGVVRSLNSTMGNNSAIDEQLSIIQHKLFDLGAQVAQYKGNLIKKEDIVQLEQWIDEMQENLSPLKQFILPAGNPAGSQCHLARTTCRRAERKTWKAAKEYEIEPEATQYLNRLSDYLFVLARTLNDQDEVFWQVGG
ncbi:cob(I)yrinic acid a,c-diamide adenosyltransferase [Marinicella rhabdoformis]|uniref:cob(I)yrinic acid a,c-diamide adenosyltransferase n=1 Tax=Marinicella rhabdoformis TaxID=2580566 RepID=UPI0012AEBFB2|nr:cob(I)yrinic acid a,c-diamide adenosyltransferase [Marinicella rhabdoformis]